MLPCVAFFLPLFFELDVFPNSEKDKWKARMSYDPMENAFLKWTPQIKNESETGGHNEDTFTKKTFLKDINCSSHSDPLSGYNKHSPSPPGALRYIAVSSCVIMHSLVTHQKFVSS